MEKFEKSKKETPIIQEKTGVTHDYINEYAAWKMYDNEADFYEDAALAKAQRGKLIRHYAERYPPDQYGDLVTDKNRAVIQALDHMADDINQKYDDGTLKLNELKQSVDEVQRIIKG